MQRILRILALAVALATAVAWLGTGAHRGWTQTRVTVMETEPVTGLEHPVTHRQFVMGIELLGAGLILAGSLAIAAFLPKFNKPQR
jgi:hypothetical protein